MEIVCFCKELRQTSETSVLYLYLDLFEIVKYERQKRKGHLGKSQMVPAKGERE